MSRGRLVVAAAVVVIFIIAGGVLIYATGHKGGRNVTWNVTVTGAKTMTPSELTAHVNDTVTINIKSDMDGEVHLHLYDIPFDAKAGQTVSHTFKADKSGHCLIEWESTSQQLGFLDVTP
jgi:hypothetical protein